MKRNPLLDREFLAKLDAQTNHEVFAKIISLTFDEHPTEEISGKATGGSINIDGDSAVRRTCSLTMVAQDVNINDYYWGLNTKFLLYIGLKNDVDPNYEDIIWFKMGMFLIASFNTSLQTNGYTINLSGKDKMCLLNGDMGGVVESVSADFGKIDEVQADGSIVTKDLLLKDIILEAVHHYGREPFENIVIEDLDDSGLELMEYRGDTPFYLLFDEAADTVNNMRFDDPSDIESLNYKIYDATIKNPKGRYTDITINLNNDYNAIHNQKFIYDSRITNLDFTDSSAFTRIWTENTLGERRVFTVAKVEYGMTCGYRVTDLTYAGDLIIQTGGSITSMLDKIKQMLGEYEYFYDVDGRFHFCRKKTYLNTSWNNIISRENEEYVDSAAYSSAVTYSFTDSNLVSSFANNPNLSTLKNDFSIWGTRTDGTQIHLRYAIDQKPIKYTNYDGITYTTLSELNETKEILDKLEEEVAAIELEYQITIGSYNNYQKKPNPRGLSEDWWDVLDWANKYAIITGEYPSGALSNYLDRNTYWKNGREANINDIFPEPTYYEDYYYPYSGSNGKLFTYGIDNPTSSYGSMQNGYSFNVFDVNLDGTLGYFGHGVGCSHSYSVFLANSNHNVTSYVYKPSIPQADYQVYEQKIQVKREEAQKKIEEAVANYRFNCDWRELIYQMALDYYKHGHAADFIPTIAKNNPDVFPTGYTGYEQYYADMQGFWRELYNPDVLPISLSENTIPNEDNYHYYVWDDETETFSPYTFNQATSIKPIPNLDLYYTSGTFLLENVKKMVEKSEATQDAENNKLYYNADNITAYYQVSDDTCQVYKKYANYSAAEKYYNYGLALDLTNVSETKHYYYCPDEHVALKEYRLAPTIEGTHYYSVGNILTDSAFNADTFYVLKTTDTYERATERNDTTIYYRKTAPTNFNVFQDGQGVKYYAYNGYALAKTLSIGNQYYKMTRKYVSADSINNKNDFYLSHQTYYVKNGNNYVPAKVYDPALKDKYYIEDFYELYLDLSNPDILYFTADGGQVTEFTIGQSYYIKNRSGVLEKAFDYEFIDYYILLGDRGYEEIKDLTSIKQGNAYAEFPSGDLLTKDYQFIAPNVYYGYTLADGTDNGEYYLAPDFVKRRVLHHFERNKNYYYIAKDYDALIPEEISLNSFVNLYYKDEKNAYVNCWEKAQELYDAAPVKEFSPALLDTIFEVTGVRYDIIDATHRQAVVSALSRDRQFFLYEKKFRKYHYLTYTFFKLASKFNAKDQYFIYDNKKYSPVTLTADSFELNKYYIQLPIDKIKVYTTDKFNLKTGWTFDLEIPEKLIFWFDFLDTTNGGELSQYGVHSVGNRPKAVKDDTVKAIYYRDTPNIIFIDPTTSAEVKQKSGYTYLNLTENIENLFAISAQGKTAFNALDSFLYSHAQCVESVTLNTLPIYYLEPNTRIFVYDKRSGINGEYLVSKLSIPLTYNGMMSITASKAVDRIY